MPTLGFLKKKRTKDSSSGSRDLDSPTSPQREGTFANQPTEPKTNNQATGHGGTTSSTAASHAPQALAAPSKPVDSMYSTPEPYQQQAHQPQQSQHNVPSIQNLIHPTNAPAQSYPHSQHSQQVPRSANSGMPAQSAPAEPAAQPQTRATKGKYTLTDFTIQRTLGTGSFGRVHLVQSKHNQRFYAVKVLKKAQVVKMKQVEHTNDERRMLQQVKHPFLITLWGTFQDSKNLYMVMDFVEGGELFSLLRKSQVGQGSVGVVLRYILGAYNH